MSDVAAALCRYARRMHAAIGAGHHVASPLGAWLLLALASSAADDPGVRADLTDALGMSSGEAGNAGVALLERPHSAVHLAAAAWHREPSEPIAAWLNSFRHVVESGPVPAQEEADKWADERTLGLIKQFPLSLGPETLLVLVTAVACSITWRTEFETRAARELLLPRSAGFADLTRVLRSPPGAASELIVDTDQGPVAVHAMESAHTDMLVVSVIADPEIPPDAVLDHAHRIAVALGRGAPVTGRRSLFDLPLGTGHSWVLSEARGSGYRDEQHFETLLPAWSARSSHKLLDLGIPGFASAAEALRQLVKGDDVDAAQAAMARYTRNGFEAAAVTGTFVAASAVLRPSRVRARTARVEFGHPYAVVAVAGGQNSAWAGVPLFSAWVATPEDA